MGRGIRKTVDLYTDIVDLIILADQYEFEAETGDTDPRGDEGLDEEEEEAQRGAKCE